MAAVTLELSPYNTYTLRIPITDIGTGRTVKAKLCEDLDGNPSAIASALDVTLSEGPTGETLYYVGDFVHSDLLTSFATRFNDTVAVHVYDGAGYHTSAYAKIVGSRPLIP